MTCDYTAYFYSISVISKQFVGDNEKLCAMEPHFQYTCKKFPPPAGLEPGTALALTKHKYHEENPYRDK